MIDNLNPIILHTNKSRKESLKRRLSEQSWQRGLGSFFCDGVPFAFSTGLEFADQLRQCLEAIYQIKNEPISCMELGAGLGFLSKHIADCVYEKNPELAKKTTFFVTDSTKALVKSMKDSDMFQPYKQVMTFMCMDATNPELKKPVDLVVMAYVLDSLGTRHLRIRNGQIYEVVVQSAWNNQIVCADTRHVPPNILNPEQITSIMSDDFTPLKRTIIRQLSEGIIETFSDIPLSESDMQDDEKNVLLDFVKELDLTKDALINFSYETLLCLKKLCANKTGIIAYYDVGQKTNSDHVNELTGQYGATQFYPLYTPFVRHLAKTFGYDICESPYPYEKGQLTLLCKKEYAQSVNPMFAQIMKKEAGEASRLVGEELSCIPIEDPEFDSYVKKSLSGLTTYEQKSHTLLMSLAIAYKKRKNYERAIFYAEEVIKIYGEMAVSTWHLLAEIYYYQGRHQEALSMLEIAIKNAPDYVGSYHVQSLVFSKTGKIENAIQASKQVVQYAGLSALGLSHLYTIVLLELSLKNREKAKEILLWIRQTYVQYSSLFSATYMKTINTCYEEFFRFGVQNAPPPKK